MESSRFTRALKLLNLLHSGHGATVDYLAHSLACSKRTVFRDIKLLKANNIRVWFDDRLGGYKADRQLWALTSSMEDDELENLLIAVILSPVTRMRPYSGTVDQAVSKMMKSASSRIRERVNRLVRAIILPTPLLDLEPGLCKVFHRHAQAIVDRSQVRIHWDEARDVSPHSTKLSPYQLAVVKNQWTVVGRSTLHRKVIGVPLTVISDVEETADSYEIPVEYLRAGHTGTTLTRPSISLVGTIPPPPKIDSDG